MCVGGQFWDYLLRHYDLNRTQLFPLEIYCYCTRFERRTIFINYLSVIGNLLTISH